MYEDNKRAHSPDVIAVLKQGSNPGMYIKQQSVSAKKTQNNNLYQQMQGNINSQIQSSSMSGRITGQTGNRKKVGQLPSHQTAQNTMNRSGLPKKILNAVSQDASIKGHKEKKQFVEPHNQRNPNQTEMQIG